MKKETFLRLLSKTRILLPPLSGFTDYPYRVILSKFNPPFMITEMVNARAVVEKNPKTNQMLQKVNGTHCTGAQLVGNNPKDMKNAAIQLEKEGFDYIDINMGCTVKKVVSKGQGIALMNNEKLAQNIIGQLVQAVEIPVTVKMRLGYSDNTLNVIPLIKNFSESGVCAVTIHGRTGERKFGSTIDYKTIAEASKESSIPIIANGGITGNNAIEILQKTKATAIMPGRSLIGNPWIIKEIMQSIQDKPFQVPSLEEKKKIIREHVNLMTDFYGASNGIIRFRKILPKYFISCRNSIQLKEDVKIINTLKQVEDILDNFHDTNEELIYMKHAND